MSEMPADAQPRAQENGTSEDERRPRMRKFSGLATNSVPSSQQRVQGNGTEDRPRSATPDSQGAVDIAGLRFNPPPGWPPAPENFVPQPGWQPDPSWPPPPPGWRLWVDDQQIPAQAEVPRTAQPGTPPGPWQPAGPPQPGYGTAGSPYRPAAAYGHPGSPGMPYAPTGQPPASGKTSGWAIASFVLGLVGGVVLSPIFGVVALRRIKRLGQRGRGLAIAGLALSGAWIVLIVAAAALGNLGSATRSPTTSKITHSGSLSVFSLAVGDCFNNPPGATSLTSVTATPCSQAHNAQIYAKFNLSGSILSYPGTPALTRLATSGCNARIGSLDKSKITNSMTIRFLFPLADSWLDGQRTVACMISNPAANITSSVLNP